MILVDTSIWIELLNGKLGKTLEPDELFRFVTCGPVLQEVFQGLREGAPRDGAPSESLKEAMLAIPRVSDPMPLEAYLEGAEIYRRGRKKGFTIRSSTDCLIAAVAIRNRVPVWHKDRDFDLIAKYTGLETRGG